MKYSVAWSDQKLDESLDSLLLDAEYLYINHFRNGVVEVFVPQILNIHHLFISLVVVQKT